MGSLGFAGAAHDTRGRTTGQRHQFAKPLLANHPCPPPHWLLLAVCSLGSAALITSFDVTPSFAAEAVSAADKATARSTATEGIELYRQQKYSEALDRMQRAQQLFDAPVHLLYIARCQERLGQWVEAAETYRALLKTELAADAPDAFVEALSDGKAELEALQPRIPRLLVRILPPDAPDLSMELDGKPLSSAVVGIERPLNPGQRTLVVRATGHAEQAQTFDAVEGELVQVELMLEPAAEPSTPPAAEVETPRETKAPPPRATFLDTVALLLRARLGAAIPAGQAPGALVNIDRDEPVKVREFAGPGTELELHVGSHFLDRWAISAFLGIKSLGDKSAEFEGTVRQTTGQAGLATFGVNVLGGTRRGKFGGFGELGLGVLHGMAVSSERSAVLSQVQASCKVTATASGLSARLGAGLNIPLYARAIHLTPYIALEAARATNLTFEEDCPVDPEPSNLGQTHTTLSIGLGGDFFIGGVP